MSKKDFDEYYNSLCDQCVQLTQMIEEFQKKAVEEAVEPERLEALKKTFQPILDNYQMISWVAFLLNKPARKQKQEKYNNMMKKKTLALDSKFNRESILQKNSTVLSQLEKEIK